MKTLLLKENGNMLFSPVEDTQYVMFVAGSSTNLEIKFEKEGVSCEIIILGKVKKGNSVVLNTVARHLVPNTSCLTNYHVVLEESSSSEYTGKIIIAKKAFQTNSYLNNKTLVVGEGVRNISKPELEIEADDVKASHGSGTGRIREEDIFYLVSRGLSRKEAEETIIEGFFENILSKIADGDVREKVRAEVKS